MSKQVTTQVDYPVDVETAFAAITAQDWTSRLAVECGASHTLTSLKADSSTVVIVTSRSLPQSMPSALGKIIPSGARPTKTDVWEATAKGGVRRGSWKVVSPGVPAEVGGTMRLEPASAGSRLVVDVEVKVKVPVIGGKMEGFLIDMTKKESAEEGVAAARLLGS